jgi:general secretion pathway protein I
MRRTEGFTLLEVLVAVALLGSALVMVVQAQAANAVQTQLARDLTVGSLLARQKVAEVEIEIRKKQSFDDLDEQCGSGDFADQGFPAFSWDCKNEPMKLQLDQEQLTASLQGIANGELDGGLLQMASDFGGFDLGGLADSPQGQMVMQALPLFTDILGKAIRRVSVTVSWEFRDETIKIPVVLFLTDPARVINPFGVGLGDPNAAAGLGGLGGAGAGGVGAGGAGNPGRGSGGDKR